MQLKSVVLWKYHLHERAAIVPRKDEIQLDNVSPSAEAMFCGLTRRGVRSLGKIDLVECTRLLPPSSQPLLAIMTLE
jgi:hypothetical protein